MTERLGVLLMTYGSPTGPDDVGAYLSRVRGGREPDPELVAEFARRYAVIGGSPLIAITRLQAAAVAERLAQRLGGEAVAAVGMRFSAPSITDGLRDLARAGASRVAAIILSPQFSPLLMGGYQRAVDAAFGELEGRETVRGGARPLPDVRVAGAWHLEPAFLDALAGRVNEALARFGPDERDSVPVLFTAHSLPRRVAEQEPDYLAQLRATAEGVAARVGLSPERWRFCWQSAGHEPGEWMKPDFADLMPELAAEGHRTVLVCPVQFLADHLEVLYDIDVGAREQAEERGLRFARIRSLNDDPLLAEALARVAERTLAEPALEVAASA